MCVVFTFRNLDDETRAFMLREFESDLASGLLYKSTRFSDQGRADYPALMRSVITSGTEVELISELNQSGRLEIREQWKGTQTRRVPRTAAETFAEGEFNRFYARGVCLRSADHKSSDVEVYRAKAVASPRSESIELIGRHLPALTLLDDLRTNVGVDTALGLPPGPNSGLSTCCVCGRC